MTSNSHTTNYVTSPPFTSVASVTAVSGGSADYTLTDHPDHQKFLSALTVADTMRGNGLSRADALAMMTKPDSVTRFPEDMAREAVEAVYSGEPEEADLFRRYTLADLKRYKPDPSHSYAGDGWLRPMAMTLLTGGTGIGKSVLAEQFCISCAAGKNILGMIPVPRPLRVTHVQAENDLETMQRDFLSIVDAIGADFDAVNQNLALYHLPGFSGEDFTAKLAEIMAREQPEVLAIDPYQCFVAAQDLNSTAAFLGFIKPVQQLLFTHKTALLLVAHTPKPRERDTWTQRESVYMAAGSSAIANTARTSCELVSAGQEENRFKLTFGKNAERTGLRNDNTGAVIRHVFIEHSGCVATPYWRVSDNQLEPSRGKYDAAISEYLAENIGANDEEVSKAVGCVRQTVWRWRRNSK